MSNPIVTSQAHHVTLTVRDVNRSRQFYLDLFNFQFVTDFGPRAILSNGSLLLVLAPPPDPDQAVPDDRFDENRVGLDHLSLSVATRADLEAALRTFDERGVSHGEIKPLEPFGIAVLAFRDPDNIQIELTAPLADGFAMTIDRTSPSLTRTCSRSASGRKVGRGPRRWRGKVQHALSRGQYFREWEELIAFVEAGRNGSSKKV
jgi:catechol 2,3-dioxygenase-like lactoylglutathione lyase family enzyme